MAKSFSKGFYNSKSWKDTREYCLMRDHFECAYCGDIAEEVHHKIWLTQDNVDNIDITLNPKNLICLCHNCHTKVHSNTINSEYFFDENGLLKKIF